jgi:hypothetical protein
MRIRKIYQERTPSESLMNDIRYPVGKFSWPEDVTAEKREDYIRTIETLPAKVRAAAAKVPAAHLDTPYREGGWSIRQMVHHLPDSHMNSFIRFKLALTENEPIIKPYDEAACAELVDSRTGPIEVSLDLLAAVHRRWVILLRGMSDGDYERTFRHPEIGLVKLKVNLALYDWHSRHHLELIVRTGERLIS